MKTKTSQTTRKNKYLRFGAGALLLSILFVFVFAGVLSASFAVEEKAIENGLIGANVAEAASYTGSAITLITFVARFTAIQMTSGYRTARASFLEATGLTLPALSRVNGYYMSAEKEIDIGGSTADNGATADTLSAVNAALQQQINVTPSTVGGTKIWTYSKVKQGTTYDCEVRSSFQEEGNGGLVVVRYSEEATPQMTAGYAQAREDFKTITGYTLPELADCELLESSDLRTDQHTTACFDITGTADDMAVIIAALQPQVGHDPTFSDETGTSWNVTVQIGETWYVGQIWTMLDTGVDLEGAPYSYVYVNFNVGEVSASYYDGRQNFYEVTGVLLPLLSGVEADDSYPYHAGDTGYCFDLIDGDALSHYTYEQLKAFLDEELSEWSIEGPTVAGDYTNVDYTSAAGWIGLTWDDANQAVYVNANMN